MNGAVHFFFGIIKDSKARDAVGQKIGIGFRITLGDAQQDDQASANLADDAVLHGHPAGTSALEDGDHQLQPSHCLSVAESRLMAAIWLGTFSMLNGFRYSTCRLIGPV